MGLIPMSVGGGARFPVGYGYSCPRAENPPAAPGRLPTVSETESMLKDAGYRGGTAKEVAPLPPYGKHHRGEVESDRSYAASIPPACRRAFDVLSIG